MEGIGGTYLILMSALYFLPLTMPSRVGVWLSLKLRVTSYTAVTVRQTKYRLIIKKRLILSMARYVCVFVDTTCALKTLQRGGESFGSG